MLSPAESADVAQLSARRNLDHCVRFEASCDPSLLTSPEIVLVAESYRQRRRPGRQ